MKVPKIVLLLDTLLLINMFVKPNNLFTAVYDSDIKMMKFPG